MRNWIIGIFGLFALVLGGCAVSPKDVRSFEPTAVVRLAKSPVEAAHCIAALMDDEMRYGLLKRGMNNHIRIDEPGASVVSNAEMGITVWLVDIEKVEGGSVATFHVGNQMHIYTEAIRQDGRRILELCSQEKP